MHSDKTMTIVGMMMLIAMIIGKGGPWCGGFSENSDAVPIDEDSEVAVMLLVTGLEELIKGEAVGDESAWSVAISLLWTPPLL